MTIQQAVTPGNKCPKFAITGTYPVWLKSHYALEPTLNIIGNVPQSTSILIQQPKNDSQTPVQQGFCPGTANIFRKMVGLPEATWSKEYENKRTEDGKSYLHN